MIDVTFEFPDTFEAYRRQLEETPQAVDVFLSGTMRGYLEDEKAAKLGKVPGAVSRPIIWTPAFTQDKAANVRLPGIAYYSKQKAAYFATDGFGGGIPSQRTGAIADSWEVVVNLEESRIGFDNLHPAALHVIGRRRQRFHENTGWQREDEIALEILISPDIENVLIDGWISIVDIGNSLA